MPTYIFRVIQNYDTYTQSVNQLIDKYKGNFKTLNAKDGFIYETEFDCNEDLEKFKAELNELFPYS